MTNRQRKIKWFEDLIQKHQDMIMVLQYRRVREKLKQDHVWSHGDVFRPKWAVTAMIYLDFGRSFEVYNLRSSVGPATNKTHCLDGAKFLFNIREKL